MAIVQFMVVFWKWIFLKMCLVYVIYIAFEAMGSHTVAEPFSCFIILYRAFVVPVYVQQCYFSYDQFGNLISRNVYLKKIVLKGLVEKQLYEVQKNRGMLQKQIYSYDLEVDVWNSK